MNFGNEEHPKWSEKEEMTLIFLAAFQSWGPGEIRGELNALFGNERSLEAIANRMKKDDRAIAALRDLCASNPITIAKFWRREGIVGQDVYDEDNGPMIVTDADTIREVMAQPESQKKPLDLQKQVDLKEKNSPLLITRLTKDEIEFDKDAEITVDQAVTLIKVLKD